MDSKAPLSMKADMDTLYNNTDLVFMVKIEGEIVKYKDIHCVPISWQDGYPMPGVKLGESRELPYYKQSEINKDGLYTEARFKEMWRDKIVRIFNENGVDL